MRKLVLIALTIMLALAGWYLYAGMPLADTTPTLITGKTIISKTGNYVLGRDISCTAAGEMDTCIEIRANNAVLDCQGHSMTLKNRNIRAPASTGIFMAGVRDVSIRNCRIENFDFGIFLKGSYNNFTNNTISNNGMGIYYDDYSSHNNFVNNTVSDNDNRGVYLFMRSSNNTFTGNTIRNNGIYGIIITCAAHHNTFSNNVIEGNGYDSISGDSGGVYILNSYANVFSSNRICNNSITVRCEFDPRMESTTEMCWLQELPHTVPIDANAERAGALIDGGRNACQNPVSCDGTFISCSAC
ncbi:MAG: right-handed parallel beta-helix repeat-containing protein [Candidatus Aenigmatarchaeota archaeon]